MKSVYTPIDIALLNSEWAMTRYDAADEPHRACPTCGRMIEQLHAAACEHDLALAERSFPTQAERDAARRRFVTTSGPTLPPSTST
jgi:hypothetical protein